MKTIALVVGALVLAGCQTQTPIGSVVGGECRIVKAPQFAVRGKTAYDQGWVNRTTEAIVVGCRQRRPQARPPELDRPAVVAKPAVVARAEVATPIPIAVKDQPRVTAQGKTCRPHWWRGNRWWQMRACRQ